MRTIQYNISELNIKKVEQTDKVTDKQHWMNYYNVIFRNDLLKSRTNRQNY